MCFQLKLLGIGLKHYMENHFRFLIPKFLLMRIKRKAI